ncbi:MAG: carboxylesterase family protein [Pseudomonadota bacterium]
MRWMLMVLAVVAASACAKRSVDDWARQGKPDEATALTLAQGEVVGFQTEGGVRAWLGLPFAEPPKDELRYRAPRPAKPWDGRLEAVAFGPRCPQMTNGLNRSEGVAPGLRVGDEDCLRLNVFAPRDASAEDGLPVMVWIHGGGNVWGRAGGYDPSDLVVNENVIVVTVQYRLGPLGWFAHEALRRSAEGSNDPLDASANFGTLDLIASLNWVRDNIAAFGGAPGNVTIFGESAGGHNVVTLLAAPQAKGLFHKAIIQSGSFDSVAAETAERGEDVMNASSTILRRIGATTAEDLRGVSVDAIFDAYSNGGMGVDLPKIISGDPVLPTPTLRDAFTDQSTFNAVPIISGTNKDEMKLFQAMDPALVNATLGLLIKPKDQGFYDALSDYQSRLWRVRSVDLPAEAMAAAGHGDVWGYRFDWDEGGKLITTDFSTLFGAAHAFEIPFVFGNFKLLGPLDRVVFGKKTETSRRELSRAMQRYWGAFARNGAPDADSLPAWPAYVGESSRLMRFDSAEDGGVGVIEGRDSVDAILSDLAADARIDDAERCDIARALAGWAPQLEGGILRDSGCAAA